MEKKSITLYRLLSRNRIHLVDNWDRPIYSSEHSDITKWYCDVNCGNGVPNIHYVNSGKSYNYDGEPDYPVNYDEII